MSLEHTKTPYDCPANLIIKKHKRKVNKIEIGDLVQCGKDWNNRVGLVIADEKAFWCIENHFDVCNCIVHKESIKIIKKQVVPKKYIKYLK